MYTFLIALLSTFIILRILMLIFKISYAEKKIIVISIATLVSYFATLTVAITTYDTYPIKRSYEKTVNQPFVRHTISDIDTTYAYKASGDSIMVFDTTFTDIELVWYTDGTDTVAVGTFDSDGDTNKRMLILNDTSFDYGVGLAINDSLDRPKTVSVHVFYDTDSKWVIPIGVPNIVNYYMLYLPTRYEKQVKSLTKQ